jgi:hypothetical protein
MAVVQAVGVGAGAVPIGAQIVTLGLGAARAQVAMLDLEVGLALAAEPGLVKLSAGPSAFQAPVRANTVCATAARLSWSQVPGEALSADASQCEAGVRCIALGFWDTGLEPMRRAPRWKAGPLEWRWAACSRAA